MTKVQIDGILTLFKAIALMEDEIKPEQTDNDATDSISKLTKARRAIQEKRALVKRTHPALLTLRRDSTATAFTISAGDVFSISWDDQKICLTTASTDADGDVSYPSGVIVIPLSDVVDARLSDIREAAMAAVSNRALADNPSTHAQEIVELLDLTALVESVKKAQNASASPAGSLAVMWFPVAGWRPLPAFSGIEQIQPDADATYPISPFIWGWPSASASADATNPAKADTTSADASKTDSKASSPSAKQAEGYTASDVYVG